jgi:SAM-dependent methyltransferase
LSAERDSATASTEAAWNLTAEKFASDIERDVAFLRSGGVNLEEPELRVLRKVISGGSAIHLQCSHGLDTLSLLNLGIGEVIGLDISERMLALAREKSDLLRAPARWVHADVLEPPAELFGLADLVYTGKGALPWVRDIGRWAAVVKSLLRDGGHLFVFEGHPLDWIWDPEADTHRLHAQRSYFDTQARANEDFPARAVERYASPDQVPPPAWEYHWSLGDLVTAVVRAGLLVEVLEEHDAHYWPRFTKIPARDFERVPHTFSLLARSTTA